jgi:2-haloacid dehalogenase
MTLTHTDSKSTKLRRRSVLVGGVASCATLAFGAAADNTKGNLPNVKALIFDVYGTCVDVWGSVVRQGEIIGRRRGLSIDWAQFANDWRDLYRPGFAAVIDHKTQWQSVASIRDTALDRLASDQRFKDLNSADIDDLKHVWQRLDPWPDTIPGLSALKHRFTLATLSNADMSGMIELAKNRGLPWDVILAAELAQTFKPDPKVYQIAPRYLGLRPDEILMVACHKYDLRAAKAQGFRTAFVARPLELGPRGVVDAQFSEEFDLNTGNLVELADRLHS